MQVELSAISQVSMSAVFATVKLVMSAMTVPVAIFTFWLGYRQKDHERMLTYYHKAVVDDAFPKILSFFESQIAILETAGREALAGISSTEKAMPRSCAEALQQFSVQLFYLKDSITQRTGLFDEAITPLIEEEFEDIQDQVLGWFNDISLFKRRDLQEMRAILSQGQREIVRKIYRGQFRDSSRRKWFQRSSK